MGEMSTDTHDNDRRLHSEHNGLFIGGWYHGIPLMFAPLPYDDDLNHDKISGGGRRGPPLALVCMSSPSTPQRCGTTSKGSSRASRTTRVTTARGSPTSKSSSSRPGRQCQSRTAQHSATVSTVDSKQRSRTFSPLSQSSIHRARLRGSERHNDSRPGNLGHSRGG